VKSFQPMKTPFIEHHPLARFLALSTVLLTSAFQSDAAVKLITGDSANNLHNNSSTLQDLSADGDYVLFTSGPPPVGSTPGITEGGFYVRRISTNSLTFVGDTSVPNGPEGSFSDNGRYLTWRASDTAIYWRDSVGDVTRLITPSANGASRRPLMSADGRYVAYVSVARNLVSNSSKLQANGRPGIYLYDSSTQTTTVVSLGQSGVALNTGVGSAAAVAAAGNEFDFSADGKSIVFSSDATNVHSSRPSNYTAGFLCIYRRNLTSGAVDLVNRTSKGAVAVGNFFAPRVSANGSRVVFYGGFIGLGGTTRIIDSVDNVFGSDLFVKDISSGAVWWASATRDKSVSDGAYGSFLAISGDGQTVAFASTGTKFVSGNTDPAIGNNGTFDIFRVDLLGGGSVFTSLVTNSPNGSGNVDYRVGPLLPGNGDYTAFCTSQVAAMMGTGSTDTVNFQGFSVSAPALPKVAEISVQQPQGSELADGSSKKSFGTVKVGKKGAAKKFIIENTGTAALTGIGVSVSGTHAKEFKAGKPAKTTLAQGESTSFTVTFQPAKKGTRKAELRISSSDSNENPFNIDVTGRGAGK
jgi:WD40-like Beta Propeller Repeat